MSGTELVERMYFNYDFKDWINSTFKTKEGQDAAWKTFAYIKNVYPETSQYLRGDLVKTISHKTVLNGGNNGSNKGSYDSRDNRTR